MNLSAVMVRLDQIHLTGYTPAPHYQRSLLELVKSRLGSTQDLAKDMYRWSTDIEVAPHTHILTTGRSPSRFQDSRGESRL